MVQSSSPLLTKLQTPLIRKLAQAIESIWHSQLTTYAYDTPADLGYVEGTLEGDRLIIENHCYQTTHFRKLHLELAKVGNNLDILHCVMFPHTQFHLPIYGVDIVAGRGSISAAIVDLSPVSPNQVLPNEYNERLEQLQASSFTQRRPLPAWGNIFSKFCVFIRPANPEEEIAFFNQATQYLLTHCQLTRQTFPTTSLEEQKLIVEGQKRYCLQQQKNDKTRRILENAFGVAWADRYLRTMLFDSVEDVQTEENLEKVEISQV